MARGIGGHHNPVAESHDWITPQHVLSALGRFDLDPCESQTQPWPCAERGYTIVDDGLKQKWIGRVFCNPPYGNYSLPFMQRMATHRNGIGLLFGRTETEMFREHIWAEADGILFLHGRLTFHKPDGTKAKGNSGGPSVLIAYGQTNVQALRDCGLTGALVTGWELQHGANTYNEFGRPFRSVDVDRVGEVVPPATYKTTARCRNCGFTGEVQLERGKSVYDSQCPNCGCNRQLGLHDAATIAEAEKHHAIRMAEATSGTTILKAAIAQQRWAERDLKDLEKAARAATRTTSARPRRQPVANPIGNPCAEILLPPEEPEVAL